MDLVIGHAGFIGCHLVAELRRRGRPVRGYDLHPAVPGPEGPDEEWIADILDSASLRASMAGCDVVYHLAGNPNLWHRDPRTFDRVNHQGTRRVVEAAAAAGVRRLVYTGTESILVPRRARDPVTEDVEPTLRDVIGPYCLSKFRAEQAVFAAARTGTPAVVVAPTMPIGPGDQRRTPPTRMIQDFLAGRIPGYIEGALNFVDVRDVAIGHVQAAERGRLGTRYILAGTNATLREFFRQLSRLTGRPAPRFRVPYPVALGFSYLEEWIGYATGRVPQSSVAGVQLCHRQLIFDGARTWAELGHRPRPLEASLRDALAWLEKSCPP